MANRYWVGGSGTWNTTSTTNWSASSGGGSGASVPTTADSVFFDQAGTYTVTMTGALACLDLTVSAGTVTFATGTTPTLTVAGSWSTIAGTVWSMTGAVTFTATTSKTLTSGGITINSPFTFNGAAGTWTLQDSFTFASTITTTLTLGTLALGSFTLTTGLFSANNTNTKSINFGTGKIVLISATAGTIWNVNTTGFTYSGTSLVECRGGGTAITKSISMSGGTAAQAINFSLLETSGTVTYTIINASFIGNLIVNGSQTVASGSNIVNLLGFTHLTTNGTTTFSASSFAWTFVATSGSYTIGNIAGVTYDFPWTFGSTTYGASTAVYTLGANLTLGATRQLTFVSGTFDFNSKTLSSAGVTINNTVGSITIANTGTASLSLTVPITHTSGTLSLPFDLTTSGSYTFTAGSLTLNTYTLNATVFSSSNSNVRTINFGSTGQITLTSSGVNIISMATVTSFTYTGTPRIYSNYSGSVGTRTFVFGSTAGATSTNVFDISFGTSGTGLVINPATDIVSFQGSYFNADFTNVTNTISNNTRSLYGNLIIPATGGTFTAGSNITTMVAATTVNINVQRTIDFPFTVDSAGGTLNFQNNFTLGSTRAFTLTSGTIVLSTYTISAATLSSNNSNTRVISFGTGQITLVGNAATLVDMATMTGFTYTGTPKIYSTYNGATGTRTFNLGGTAGATTTNIFDVSIGSSGTGIVITAGTDSVDLVGSFINMNLTGLTMTIPNSIRIVYGNVTVPVTGGTFTAGTNTTTLAGYSGSFTIDTANRILDFPISIDGNGNFTLSNSYICGSSSTVSTKAFTLTTGNLTLSNTVIYTGQFVTTSSNVRSIAFTGTLPTIQILNSGTTVWNSNIGTNFTWSGSLQVNSTYTSNVGTRVFDFGTIAEAYAPNVKITTGTAGFNIGTANDTVTLTGAIGSLDLTGLASTLTITNTARTIYGNLTIPATGGTFTAGAVATTFGATSGTKTIDTANRALAFPITFNGVGGNWTLANGLTANATTVLTLTNGQVNFNQQTITFANITVLTGNAGLSNLNTTLAFVHTSGNLTIASGAITSTTSNTYTIATGTLSANAAFTTAAFTLTNGNVTANATLTTSTFTHTAGNLTTNTGGSANTQAYTIAAGNITIASGGDLTCPTFTTTGTTAKNFQFGGNINVTSTGSVFTIGSTTNLTTSGSGNVNVTNAGSTPITVSPGNPTEANAINFNFTAGTYALTITSTAVVDSLNFTGFAGTVANVGLTVYGNLTLSTGMTWTGGTGVLTLSGANNQTLTSATKTIDSPVTVNKTGGVLSIADTANIGNTRAFTLTAGNLTANASLTTGAFTHTAGTMTVNAAVSTLAYTQNGGNIILTGGDLTVTTLTSNNSTTRSIQLGTSNINVTSNGTVVDMTTTTGLTSNGTGNIQITSAGSTAITVTPGALAVANTINYNFTGGTYSLTLTAGNVKGLNFTGYAGTVGDSAMTICGNLVFSIGMTRTAGTSTYTFASTSTQSITSNGQTFDFPITINGVSGTVALNDSLTVGSTRLTTLTNGNLDLNGFTYTTGTFSTAAGTKGIIFDGGTFVVTGSGATAFNNANPTGFTTSAGTGSGTISLTSATAKTFVGGDSTYSATLSHNGTGALTITGNNTLNNLSSPITSSSAVTLILTAGTTQNLGNFSAAGQATRLLSINSTANTTVSTNGVATLNYTGSSYVSTDYISVYDIQFTSSGYNDGTSYLRWYLGTGSNNIRNIRGGLFTAGTPSTQKVYLLETGSTWTVPSDFNPTNNQIYLYGAGGGGSGSGGISGPGGGGGGGGGFTIATNFGLYPPTSVSYSIGTGGTGGANSGIASARSGTTGGTTSFSSLYANGGGFGSITATGSSGNGVGGAGGVGLTYSGGKGGNVGAVASTTGVSGPGGGSGGVYGNGGNGGTTIASASGSPGSAGGGGSGGGSNGANSTTTSGGAGGNNFQGEGGGATGTPATAGARGGGGGGASQNDIGGIGSYGIDVFGSLGGGGGAGGGKTTSTNANGAPGYGYGSGGAGGSYYGTGSVTGYGGNGGNGAIIIYYVPSSYVQWPNNMFLLF